MVDEKPNTELPPIDFSAKSVTKLRPLGSFESELKLMVERMDKLKPFKPNELIIEGMGATRSQCPFDCETWSLNMGYMQVFQIDGHFSRVFLCHPQVRDASRRPVFCWDHFNKMVDAGITVYNTHKVKGLNSKMYPYKRISRKYDTDFFSNTISYMLAMAIDEGYKKISLYGCDMMTQSEYAWEKGGLEFWLGGAKMLGIKIDIAEGSSLMQTITGKPYGVKYFNLKDIDPTRSMRRKVKKSIPETTSTAYMYEDPVRPPDPSISPYVDIIV